MTCSTSYYLCDTLMDPWNVCMYCLLVVNHYLFVCGEQQCLVSITVWTEEWNFNWASVLGSKTVQKTKMSTDFPCLTELLFPGTQGNN